MSGVGSRGGVGAYKRRLKYPATCSQCRGVFYTSRTDADTCSPRCRKRKQRGSEKETPVTQRTIVFNMGKKQSETLVLPMDSYWQKVKQR